jgi:hypothetical protein
MKVRSMVMPVGRRTRRYVTALVAAFCGALALVLLSPYALIWVGAVRQENWDRLSAIGQTYGAASAVLSALALAGVAVSLIVQSREGRATQETSVREFHRELIALTSLDPERCLPCWGWTLGSDVTEEDAGQIMFAHMICNYMALGYQLGTVSEKQLRQLTLKHFFSGEVGREYWERMGRETSSGRTGKAIQRFTAIAEDEYQKAVAQGPAVIPAGFTSTGKTVVRPPAPSPLRSHELLTAASAAAGMITIAARAVQRRRRV